MTLEEIKDKVIEAVAKGEDPQQYIKDYYETSEIKSLTVKCGNSTMKLIPANLCEITSMSVADVDSMSDADLRQALKNYAASLEQIETGWKKLVRDATIQDKKQDLGKIGIETILNSQISGNGIVVSTEDATTSAGEKVVRAVISFKGEYGYDISVGLNVNSSEDMTQQLISFANTMKQIGYAKPTPAEEAIDDMIINCYLPSHRATYWIFDEADATQAPYIEACRKVMDGANKMDYQGSPNTMQEIYDTLSKAGVNVEWIQSLYDHNKQDMKIKSNEFEIVITRGKTPGMLVACSPFFSDYMQCVAVCVSHKPLQQVAEWIKMTCETLTPIADKLMPRTRTLQQRVAETDKAESLIKGLAQLPNVTIDHFHAIYDFGDAGFIKANSEPGIRNVSPMKVAQVLLELGKTMSE